MNELKLKLRKFSKERDWDKFHTPKNLAAALSVEASELLEIFQWLTDKESKNSPSNKIIKARAEEEMADVFIYLLRLAEKMNVDLIKAAFDKSELNAKKYPVERFKGKVKCPAPL